MNKILKNFKNIKYGPAPEDDKEVIAWIKKLSSPNKNYIDGKWVQIQKVQKKFKQSTLLIKKNYLIYLLALKKM